MGKIHEYFQGLFWSKDKRKRIRENLKIYKLEPSNIAFIGDDVNDLELMKKIGLSATPYDGITQAKKIADYVCKSPGGGGVLREVSDLILKEKFPNKTKWY